MNTWKLPPPDCTMGEKCGVLPILRESIQRKAIDGMEDIHPICAVCGYYTGPINNLEMLEVREGLRQWVNGVADRLLEFWGEKIHIHGS